MNWKNYFKPHILERGREYYENGCVENFEIVDGVINANIDGNYDYYTIEISVDENEVIDMFCSCPYALDGENCKHMAAVLFEYFVGDNSESKSITNDEITNMVKNADRDKLNDFVIELLKRDSDLCANFKLQTVGATDENLIAIHKRKIDKIINKYTSGSGYVYYRVAYGFCREMAVEAGEICDIAMAGGHIQAFELTKYLLENLSDVEIDDSDGGLCDIINNCHYAWEIILDNCNNQIKEKILNWFEEQIDNDTCYYVIEVIYDLYINYFNSEALLDRKINKIEQRLKNSIDDHFQYERNIEILIELIEQKNDDSKIETVCNENYKSNRARKYLLNKCMECQDYEKAIKIIKDSLLIDNEYAGLVYDWQTVLKDIYKVTENYDEYKTIMLVIVTEHRLNLENYRELKTLCSDEEWLTVRETVFEHFRDYYDRATLFSEEGLQERLAETVFASNNIRLLDAYRDKLFKIYPNEVLEKYKLILDKEAQHTSNREQYRMLASYLEMLKKYPGGESIAKETAQSWRVKYRRRRAMMEEISRI